MLGREELISHLFVSLIHEERPRVRAQGSMVAWGWVSYRVFWGFLLPLSFEELVSVFSASRESFGESMNFLACKPRLYCGD